MSPSNPGRDSGFLWRRSWRPRVFNPAFDGNTHQTNPPPVRTYPIRPGLTFHELRHSHKTWLITAGIPEIAQAKRLGHRLDKRVVEVYSHVADDVETRIQTALKQVWLDARHTVADHPTPPPVTPRIGLIRRHLTDNSTSHPTSIIKGFAVHVPQPRTPTSTNTPSHETVGDQIWSSLPHNHPIFDQSHT